MENVAVMQKIVVLNSKGGSGKTTIATNLAAYYAARGMSVALMDMDPQGSSMRWLKVRPRGVPQIHAIAAYEKPMGVTRAFALRTPPGTERLIVDTPAAIPAQQMPEIVRDASAIVVPVLPSEIDIHAASRCIADLLLVAKVHRSEKRLVIVANRARRYTKAYHSLMKFLQSLRIPVAAVLRDSQVYVRSAETGTGLHEMKGALLQEDLDTFRPLIEWLERRSFSLVPTEDTPAADAEAEGAQVVPTIAPVISPVTSIVPVTSIAPAAATAQGPGAVPAPIVPAPIRDDGAAASGSLTLFS
jgi:chromosome partitioning protein